MKNFLEELKKSLKLNEKDFIIKDFENKDGFIVFSQETIASCKAETHYKGIDKISAKDAIARYFYIEKISNKPEQKKILTYVMLNPSYASLKASDRTINRARKLASKVGYEYFAVINLYPYRHHEPSQMFKLLNENENLCAKNCEIIKNYVAKSGAEDFVLAYGSNAHKDKEDEMLKLLENKNKFTFFRDNKEHKPYHLLCTKLRVKENGKIELISL
jgi:hypothetical protein